LKVTAGFLGQVLYVNACAMYSSTSMCSLRCSELAADGRWSMMEELAWWPIPAILNMQCRMCQATNTPQSCEFRCAGPPDRPCSSSDTVIVKSDTLGGNLDANMARSRGAMDVILDMRSITESRSSSSHLRMVTNVRQPLAVSPGLDQAAGVSRPSGARATICTTSTC
jgi:hypothetical protein